MGQDPGPACLETLVQASQGYSPGVCQDDVTSQAHEREDPSSMLTYVAVDRISYSGTIGLGTSCSCVRVVVGGFCLVLCHLGLHGVALSTEAAGFL